MSLASRSLPRPAIPAPLEGIPDVVATRCVCYGIAAMFLAVAGMLTFFFFTDPSDLDSPGMILLLGALVLGIYGLAGYFIFEGLRAGQVWLRVDGTGVYAGRGTQPGEPNEMSLAWKDMAVNRSLVYDVHGSSSSGAHATTPCMRYWRREADGSLVERRMQISLATSLRCVRFRNRDALVRAALQHVANQPGLRIHGSLFMEAGFDPETWEPRDGPRRALWGIALVTVAVTLGMASFMMDWSPLVLGMSVAVVFAICLWATGVMWTRAYPGAEDIIVFGVQPAPPQAPARVHARPTPPPPGNRPARNKRRK
ncbi:hypothetical protein [Bordetella genomosp. 13]|uniref:hypothetical protein n=1 Tax=Bordetella genomosp. 13 TaxID=463040 RepID=UPI0011A37AA0|nr:hypothetical protein [Bordetella genomosp. 13]